MKIWLAIEVVNLHEILLFPIYAILCRDQKRHNKMNDTEKAHTPNKAVCSGLVSAWPLPVDFAGEARRFPFNLRKELLRGKI